MWFKKALGTLACFALLSCQSAPSIKIGVALPLSGEDSLFGQEMLNALMLAQKESSKKNISFLIEDDRSDPGRALEIARHFNEEGVQAVLGHYQNHVIQEVLPVYSSAGVPLLTPKGSLNQHSPWLFHGLAKDIERAKSYTQYLKENHYQRVLITHTNQKDDQLFTQSLEPLLKGQFNVKTRVWPSDNFWADLNEFVPEIIIFEGDHSRAALFLQEMHRHGLKSDILGGPRLFNADFLRQAGEAHDLLVAYPKPLRTDSFQKRYRDLFGESITYAEYSYQLTQLVLEALSEPEEDLRMTLLNLAENDFQHLKLQNPQLPVRSYLFWQGGARDFKQHQHTTPLFFNTAEHIALIGNPTLANLPSPPPETEEPHENTANKPPQER